MSIVSECLSEEIEREVNRRLAEAMAQATRLSTKEEYEDAIARTLPGVSRVILTDPHPDDPLHFRGATLTLEHPVRVTRTTLILTEKP